MKTLSLNKDDQKFIINYEKGDEHLVLDHLVKMTKNPRLNFDWWDAATLADELGKGLAKELKQSLPKTL